MFELERRTAEIDRHRENSARLATEYHKLESTGQGSLEYPDYLAFDITFVEEPYITYGCQIDLDELGELQLTDPTDPTITPELPQATGFVTQWDQDDRDFYTGAWVAVAVNYPSGAIWDVHMMHHFTFTGIAMKDVPLDVRD